MNEQETTPEKRVSIPVINDDFINFIDSEEENKEEEDEEEGDDDDEDSKQEFNENNDNIMNSSTSSEEKRKNRSWIRNHITRISEEKVQCNKCKKSLKFLEVSGKISNLHHHSCFKRKSNQKNQKIPLPELEQKKITQLLLKFIVFDMRPFRTVKTDPFKKFILALNPNYVIPAYETIKRLLNSNLEIVEKKLIENIKNCQKISITTDLYTASNHEHFIILTAHYVDNSELKLKSSTIACCELAVVHATAEEISNIIKKIFLKLLIPIEKISFFTTDAGSNVKSAVESELRCEFLHCNCHIINIIAQKSTNEKLINFKSKCKSISQFIHQSGVAWQTLKKYQKNDNETNKFANIIYKIINDVSTRWNSTLHMYERIYLLSDNINQTLKDLNKNDLILSKNEIYILNEVIQVLKPLNYFTELFSSEKSVTINLVQPGFLNLILILEEIQIDNHEVKEMRDSIVNDIKIRCEEIFDKSCVKLGPLLDPRYKKLLFIQESERKEVHQLLIKEILKYKIFIEKKIEENPKKKKTEEKSFEMNKFMNISSKKKETPETQEDIIKKFIDDELKLYLAEEVDDQDLDPIEYWVSRVNMYPYLSQFSFCILSIPASSTPSERRFSSLGRIIDSRARIDSNTAALLLTLKDNITIW